MDETGSCDGIYDSDSEDSMDGYDCGMYEYDRKVRNLHAHLDDFLNWCRRVGIRMYVEQIPALERSHAVASQTKFQENVLGKSKDK